MLYANGRGLRMKQREVAFRQELVCLLPRLWRFGLSLTGAADACHDLVQATCERALTHFHQWRPGSRLDSWTFAIMHSIWKNELRARAIRRGAGFVDPDTYPLPAEARTEDAAAAGELHQAVTALPEAQRAALLLVYVEGYGYREAAEILDVPIGTVMSRLARARLTLAEQLQTPLERARSVAQPSRTP